MNASRFRNALRIMFNIEIGDLFDAAVVDENWGTPEASVRDQLSNFIRDPMVEALRMPDANFEKLFALIESKQPDAGAAS